MARARTTVRVRQTVTTTVTVETTFKFSSHVRESSDAKPGLYRERSGDGFRYRTARGALVTDAATLARIRALAIPPAWENVWICPTATGHVQATGRDARGRKQYRYHPAFRSSQEGEKFGRLAAFGKVLGRIRTRVEADLGRPGLPREKVLAAMVKLLDRAHLRVGNAEYAKTNKSFGLSTLQDRHVSFAGGSLRVKFRGKSGVWHDRAISDRRLARVVRACRDIPGQHLFQYRDAEGVAHRVGSSDVNAYIRKASGGEFTAKDFRTWAGTVAALERLMRLDPPATQKEAASVVVTVVTEVAAELGNTPAVCRKSYIHPGVFEAFLNSALPRGRRAVSHESCVLKVLAG
ncbi:dna topoisomerase i : Putative DNA topoisomerase I OS=Massilia sp. LC238 GN=FG94_01154 PE=4 SV=1: Topoisom_I [Gemmataceae bacterium]|nr:dna topoisomerase i : Putative DNA topoisomerase I OS=Massilia sp. LC238 GN=FG94_01154 PE=4 SV=1: Topoisom_I [Gemmataceae bacterium]VTU02644.1 dna topoisomerase i : Putative DNA topoisomerase I OS=Massilia sp. LC238 GN=FG94_01154 PE=4 SV=1: Topoisom_I [Gemmataceae bacterium]